MVEIGILHINLLRETFDLSLMKIVLGIIKIRGGHKIQGSIPWPSNVTLALSPHGHLDKYLTKVLCKSFKGFRKCGVDRNG